MKHAFLRTLAAVVLIAFCTSAAQAAPLTIAFRYADPNSTAQAVGSVTFESTLVQNPGQNEFNVPSAAVLALSVTVTGSANGNGSFTLADFDGFTFETNGGTLDFSRQLVGQPTSNAPWGTPNGNGGDFNLFINQGNRTAQGYALRSPAPNGQTGLPPNGEFFFTLGANGGTGEQMVLVSAVPSGAAAAVSVPALSGWSLLTLAGLFLLGGMIATRRIAAKR